MFAMVRQVKRRMSVAVESSSNSINSDSMIRRLGGAEEAKRRMSLRRMSLRDDSRGSGNKMVVVDNSRGGSGNKLVVLNVVVQHDISQ